MDKNKQFIRFFTGVQVKLHAFIMACVHNRNDADDIMQDVSVILWDKFETYEVNRDFGAWAMGITKIKVMEFLRKNRRSKMVFNDSFYQSVSDYTEQANDDINERIEVVKNCMLKLKDNERNLLKLRYHKNLTVKQVSQITGRSSYGLYKSFARLIVCLRECVRRNLAIQGLER